MANPTINAEKQAMIESVRAAARAKFAHRTSVAEANNPSLTESVTGVSSPVSVSEFISRFGLEGE